MELHELKPAQGSKKKGKRIGRGEGSGKGGTATRGHKGAQSRSGYKRKFGFEGGQLPLQRRIPKFGFKNRFRKEYAAVNLQLISEVLEKHPTQVVDKAYLHQHGIVGKKESVKILNEGTINQAVEIKADAFSAKARQAIEAAGGTATQTA